MTRFLFLLALLLPGCNQLPPPPSRVLIEASGYGCAGRVVVEWDVECEDQP